MLKGSEEALGESLNFVQRAHPTLSKDIRTGWTGVKHPLFPNWPDRAAVHPLSAGPLAGSLVLFSSTEV